MNNHIYEITHANRVIQFTLTRKKVKNINLRIKQDLTVLVSAGKNIPIDVILSFVQSKAPWIMQNQARLRKKGLNIAAQKSSLNTGDSFLLLGRPHKIIVAQDATERAYSSQGICYVFCTDANDLQKKKILLLHYLEAQAQTEFSCALQEMNRLAQVKFEPELEIKHLVSRWGECFINQKKIVLSTALMYAPRECIHYVALHELLHFYNASHDKNFHDMLTTLMPDWKKRREVLKSINIRALK